MRFAPILLALVTLVSTGLGGTAAIRLRDRLHLLLGFSSGAVLAVALFDILPEVFAFDHGASYMPITALGFLAFFALERYTAMHRAREHPHLAEAHEAELGAMSAAGLAFHSFLDGVAIGVGFQTSVQMGLLIAFGIIAHDFSDGLNTVTVVLAHGNSLQARRFLVDNRHAHAGSRRGVNADVQFGAGSPAAAACVLRRLFSLHRCVRSIAGSSRA